MVIQWHALALDEGGRWMGEPLRHVVANMGPIHLVGGNIQLQKCPIWWLLFHLIGAARGRHGLKGITTAKATKQVRILRWIPQSTIGSKLQWTPKLEEVQATDWWFTATTCLTVSNLKACRGVQQDLGHKLWVKNSHNQRYREGTCTKMSHERGLTANMNLQVTWSIQLQVKVTSSQRCLDTFVIVTAHKQVCANQKGVGLEPRIRRAYVSGKVAGFLQHPTSQKNGWVWVSSFQNVGVSKK